MRIALLGDTHFPRRGSVLPDACVAQCRAADLVVHTGDLADMVTLRMLEGLGPPVVAVHGNADDAAVRAALPATARIELPGGATMGLVHNGGAEVGRVERLRTRFPGCVLVAFGHSHIPLHAVAVDGFGVVNPGSATDRRRHPRHSMAVVEASDDGAVSVRFLDLDSGGESMPDDLVRTVG